MRAVPLHPALLAALGLSMGLLSACGGGGGDSNGSGNAPPGFVPTTGAVAVTELATGLPNPWSLAFLPDGRMLVTGRTGSLRLYAADGQSFSNINLVGLSGLTTAGQGGLLDVVVDPAFGSNRRIYFSFSETDSGNPSLNGTAVARAELDTGALTLVNWQVIYRQLPKVASTAHFGSRLVFDRNGHLFVTMGDRQSNDQRVFAQDVGRGNGKVVRITTSGAAAPGNPVIAGAITGLWSYGHRNPQGATLHPDTGELWTHEHGPQGGDEVNLTLPARNHGWPVISYGQEYGTTTQVGEGTAKAGMEQPVAYWETIDGAPWTGGQKSSIAPSGMAFFTGTFPTNWSGSLFVGALAGTALWRLQFDGAREVGRERLLANRNERIRDVRQGPDGRLYLLTDGGSGKLLRIGG
ncbi:PQQ-dependent sugar dehydrogenase [Hydrogenophaga sp. 2FB]|uniref:PQQ-dependent sugar dehydrogenase n=1 Tax=Hydrogenophaga sp. 2FB TaxID=2502187 RepID=UPI0010F98269|nr:PQQ-dependent sugar dehydrogenase [Hydrogenophaga sp. 2FB]